jgi:plastocyanin
VRRWLVAITAVIVICGTVAGCSTSNTTSPPGTSVITEWQAAATTPAAQSGPATGTGNKVAIKDAAFEPRLIQVQRGQSVTWTNDDTVAHSVTATKGGFHLPLKRGASRKHQFIKPGRVAYYCRVHPANLWMSGVVVVDSARTAPSGRTRPYRHRTHRVRSRLDLSGRTRGAAASTPVPVVRGHDRP